MTLYDFIQLGLAEKMDQVWEGGFLSIKKEKNETVVLYRVCDFFCAVHYDKRNLIVRLDPFRAKEMLHDYFAWQLN